LRQWGVQPLLPVSPSFRTRKPEKRMFDLPHGNPVVEPTKY
jgi:hypothetical protein